MELPISYRPAIGKHKLEKIVKNKLHYKSMNEFIDHAVNVVLHEEMGTNAVVRKMTLDIERVIAKHVPLKFVNASPKEAKKLDASITRSKKKGGWVTTKELMKKHGIT